MAKRTTHTLTITVTAPPYLTKAEVKREVRTNINNHSAHGSGKYVGPPGREEWRNISQGDIKVRTMA
jgi:hypothetical protein